MRKIGWLLVAGFVLLMIWLSQHPHYRGEKISLDNDENIIEFINERAKDPAESIVKKTYFKNGAVVLYKDNYSRLNVFAFEQLPNDEELFRSYEYKDVYILKNGYGYNIQVTRDNQALTIVYGDVSLLKRNEFTLAINEKKEVYFIDDNDDYYLEVVFKEHLVQPVVIDINN